MKPISLIFALCLAIGLSSCHSSKKSARIDYESEVYADQSKDKKDKKKDKKNLSPIELLLAEAYSWTGTPYRSGGHSKSGTDCSGFTMEVYRNALGVELPRNSAKQIEACDKVKKDKIQPGDLLFFHPSKKGKISHVGIYVGNGKMIHASSRGVMESSIEIPYWQKCYNQAGRVKYKDLTISEDPKKKDSKKKDKASVPKDAKTSPEWSF